MDDSQFDTLTRALSSRRTALAGLLGGVVAWLGLTAEDAGAHNAVPRCHQLSDPAKRRRCLRRARAHNRTHRCQPKPASVVCAGLRRCSGVAVNNCGKLINCTTCPAGRTCLGNGSCARICDPVTQDCPTGCLCYLGSDGASSCLNPAAMPTCAQIPQVCSSSADCAPGFRCVGPTGCGGPNSNRCAPLCPN